MKVSDITRRIDHIHPAISGVDAVLFDFDFTLADSSSGIITCINYALSEMGLGESSTEDIIKTIGLYIPEALVVLKGEKFRSRGQEFMAHFTHKADEVMVEGTFFLRRSVTCAQDPSRTRLQAGNRIDQVPLPHRDCPRPRWCTRHCRGNHRR